MLTFYQQLISKSDIHNVLFVCDRALAVDPEQLQFVLEIRSADRDQGTLWFTSTRLQKFLRRTVSAQEINLRIMRLAPTPSHALPHPIGPYSNLLHY